MSNLRLVVFMHRLGIALLLAGALAHPSSLRGEWAAVESDFRAPPQSAGIRCFWWWLNSNVDKAAITRDLEEMAAKGFSGALVFDAGGAEQRGNAEVPAGPLWGSPEWIGLFQHAVTEAARLKLELSLSIQSGWNLGGPTVTPEQSAKQLVWSETRLAGPVEHAGVLALPKVRDGYFVDVAVLAIPVRADRQGASPAPTMKARSEQSAHPAAQAADGQAETFWVSAGTEEGEGPSTATPQWLQFTFDTPVVVSGMRVLGRLNYGPRHIEVQHAADGRTFVRAGACDVEDGREATVRFAAVTGRVFRASFATAYDTRFPNRPRNVQVAELVLLDGAGRPLSGAGPGRRRPIRDLDRKAAYHELGGSAPDCRPLLFDVPAEPGEEDAKPEAVLDLSARLAADGTLRWSVPPGEWRVLRLGCTYTGAGVSTSSGAWKGRVLDYLSEAHLRTYWEAHVRPILDAVGAEAGRTLRYLATDSWECGGMNWTPGLEREFRARRGYDPLPYLPVAAGYIIGDRETSNAFLADWRKTLSDVVADRHYAVFAELARARGLGIHPESAGPHAGPFDGLKNYGRSDLMMSEFWVPSPHRPRPEHRFFVKQASSAAHTYGRRLVGAESFTSIGPHWDDVLWSAQKPSFDHEVCEGLNLVFVHTFTCSPASMGVPGQEYFAGTHFNPQVTWWDFAGAFTRYLARCQAVVQRGAFVADALYYYGDHVPNIARRKADDPARVLPGFDYDVLSEELLVGRLAVDEGRLALPGAATRYRLLALPDHRVLSLAALRAVHALVGRGADVLGPKPERAVSLEGGEAGRAEFRKLADALWGEGAGERGERRTGRGRVRWGLGAREALLADGVVPDVIFAGAEAAAADADPEAGLGWIHYRVEDGDVYFVSNPQARAEAARLRFRVQGRAPELWDPVAGTRRDAAYARVADGVEVPLALEPYGSCFVVLRRPSAEAGRPGDNARRWVPVLEVGGPWEVEFDPGRGAPERVRFDALASWTERPEPGLRHYSGRARYRAAFEWKAAPPGEASAIELGQVLDTGIARVSLNGTALGVAWCPPFRLETAGALQPGRNLIEIEVVNSWRNRLVGDRGLPAEGRFTRTNIATRPEWKVVPSGLLGPVRLVLPE